MMKDDLSRARTPSIVDGPPPLRCRFCGRNPAEEGSEALC